MTTHEFIRKLAPENVDLVNRMQACKAPEEAYEVARSVGLTDSFEEFTAEMTKLYESIKNLTEEDLVKVAGGTDTSDIVTNTVTATMVSAFTLITASIISAGAAGAAVP